MNKISKNFQVVEVEDGKVHVISSDRKQMARWYALDYFVNKPQLTEKGYYIATLSQNYYFSAGFRKRK